VTFLIEVYQEVKILFSSNEWMENVLCDYSNFVRLVIFVTLNGNKVPMSVPLFTGRNQRSQENGQTGSAGRKTTITQINTRHEAKSAEMNL